jgi:hypothetical protein
MGTLIALTFLLTLEDAPEPFWLVCTPPNF